MVDMRVHFVPQGYEKDRILAGILRSNAEKVVIVRNSKQQLPKVESDVQTCIEEVRDTILNGKLPYYFVREIDTESYKVSFFDLIDALKKIEQWISSEVEKGNDVSVNISSGNSIACCALFTVAMKHGVTIYYVVPEEYPVPKPTITAEKVSRGIKDCFSLPHIPLEYMHNIPFDILKAIDDLGGKAPSITDIVLAIKPELKGDDIRSERMKVSKRIEQLRKSRYVVVSPKGREKEISLTNLGKMILDYTTGFEV